MKLLRYSFLTVIALASSCNLDLQVDPNAVKLTETSPSLLLNNIQVDLADFFGRASTFGMQVTRLQNSGGSVYENFANPQAFDLLWNAAYANVLTDCDVLIKQADASNFTVHAGMARIMQAYTLSVLVDYFGDVPFSQAFQGLDNLNPGTDKMDALYTQIIAILDRAISDLRKTPSALAPSFTDFYYGGGTTGITRWIRCANSIKLKLFLNLRNFNQTNATQGITTLLSDAAGVMTSQSDSFIFRYGTSTADPDVRHPRFVANYLTGAGDYMANYLLWQMYFGHDMIDPRMRFYFYRQRGANSTDPNEIRCVAQTAPPHYPFSTGTAIVPGAPGMPPGISTNPNSQAWGRTFCFPTPIGYWGREHVDPQGIPPDGLARTTWGPYPAGGRFDANVNTGVTNFLDLAFMRGAGFQPILMRSSVNFMRAEAALYLGVGGPADTQFDLGVINSLTDVRDWSINGTLGTSAISPAAAEVSTINGFYPVLGTALAPVNAASIANVALSGTSTVDGVALAVGDRVLLKDQTITNQNGIWVVSSGAWTRSADVLTASTSGGIITGPHVTVLGGAVNKDARFVQITTGAITFGTTTTNWRTLLSDEIVRYRTRAKTAYDAQTSNDDRMNFIAREYWVSLFGSGVESYNLYRRTGLPKGMQPTVNPAPGVFPRTFWYPAAFEARNSQVEQKLDLKGKVFWDTFSSSLDF